MKLQKRKKKIVAKRQRIAQFEKVMKAKKRKGTINDPREPKPAPKRKTDTGYKRKQRAWRRLRMQLAGEQNWRCCYCHVTMIPGEAFANHPDALSIEHVIPKSKGGSDHWENLVAACRFCNNSRGMYDVDPMVFVNMAMNIKRAQAEEIQRQRDEYDPRRLAPQKKAPLLIDHHRLQDVTIKFQCGSQMSGMVTAINCADPLTCGSSREQEPT